MSAPIARKERITSFDFLKIIAAFFVVVIHACPLEEVSGRTYGLLRNFARFAVPFFFAVSGYFFALKALKSDSILKQWAKYVGRILPLLIGWSVIYVCLPSAALIDLCKGDISIFEHIWGNIIGIVTNPMGFLELTFSDGGHYHLWFFPAMLSGISLWVLLLTCGAKRWALQMSGILLAIGVGTIIILKDSLPVSYLWGNGPFWSASLFAFGWWAAQDKPKISIKASTWIIILGFALRIIEATLLNNIAYNSYDLSWQNTDQFSIGTTIMAAGFLLLALANPTLGKNSWLTKLAPTSLGVYALHPFWLGNIPGSLAELMPQVVWDVLFVLSVFALSSATAWLLRKTKLTRWLVE